jgi:peptide/nickel transport system permease protein
MFGLPGIGQLIMNSIQAKDFLVVQGVIMFTAIVYVVVNMLSDVVYEAMDPRVRTRAQ